MFDGYFDPCKWKKKSIPHVLTIEGKNQALNLDLYYPEKLIVIYETRILQSDIGNPECNGFEGFCWRIHCSKKANILWHYYK